MHIANKNNPFTTPHSEHVAVLTKLFAIAEAKESKEPKESKEKNELTTTQTIIAGFMWLKVNKEEVKSFFEIYNTGKRDQSLELVALGDGKGMPFHLSNYKTAKECEEAIDRIITQVEDAILWAESTKQLPALLSTLKTGCCLESHSRAMLHYVDHARKNKPSTLDETIAEIYKTLKKDALDEELFFHFVSYAGVPILMDITSSDIAYLKYEYIIDALITAKYCDNEDVIRALAKKHQEDITSLAKLRQDFLYVPSTLALEISEVQKSFSLLKLTSETCTRIAKYLLPHEIDIVILALVSASEFESALCFAKGTKNIPGNARNVVTGETVLIKLIKGVVFEQTAEIRLTLIDLLLEKGVDLLARDEEKIGVYSHALSIDYTLKNSTHTKIGSCSDRILKKSPNPEKLRGEALLEMSIKLTQWRHIIIELLKSEGKIALCKINNTSPLNYILGGIEENDIELIPLYLQKMSHPLAFANSALTTALSDNHWNLAVNLLEQKESKEVLSDNEKDLYLHDIVIANNNIGWRYHVEYKKFKNTAEYYIKTIDTIKHIKNKTQQDETNLDTNYRNLSYAEAALGEEKFSSNNLESIAHYKKAVASREQIRVKTNLDKTDKDTYQLKLAQLHHQMGSKEAISHKDRLFALSHCRQAIDALCRIENKNSTDIDAHLSSNYRTMASIYSAFGQESQNVKRAYNQRIENFTQAVQYLDLIKLQSSEDKSNIELYRHHIEEAEKKLARLNEQAPILTYASFLYAEQQKEEKKHDNHTQKSNTLITSTTTDEYIITAIKQNNLQVLWNAYLQGAKIDNMIDFAVKNKKFQLIESFIGWGGKLDTAIQTILVAGYLANDDAKLQVLMSFENKKFREEFASIADALYQVNMTPLIKIVNETSSQPTQSTTAKLNLTEEKIIEIKHTQVNNFDQQENKVSNQHSLFTQQNLSIQSAPKEEKKQDQLNNKSVTLLFNIKALENNYILNKHGKSGIAQNLRNDILRSQTMDDVLLALSNAYLANRKYELATFKNRAHRFFCCCTPKPYSMLSEDNAIPDTLRNDLGVKLGQGLHQIIYSLYLEYQQQLSPLQSGNKLKS